jgi:hypothetical protein
MLVMNALVQSRVNSLNITRLGGKAFLVKILFIFVVPFICALSTEMLRSNEYVFVI